MSIIKTLVGKPIHPEKLKGGSFDGFVSQMKIASEAAKYFSAFDKKEVSACWVCGHHEHTDALTAFGIEFLQCNNCSHVYQKYLIPDEVIYDFFKKDTNINCHLPQEQFDYRAEFVSKPKIDELMTLRKELGLRIDDGKWLDMGCGGGELLFQVKKDYEWDVLGFDLSEPGVSLANKHDICVIQSDLFALFEKVANAGNAEERFDVVSAVGYFDMVSDPAKHLKKVKEMLKPRGMLMIDQPRFNSFTIDVIKANPESAIRYCNALQRSIFTDKSLQLFLEENGFEIVLDWKYGLDFYTFMSTVAINIPNLSRGNVYKFLMKHYNDFQYIIDSNNYNDTLFYVAVLK